MSTPPPKRLTPRSPASTCSTSATATFSVSWPPPRLCLRPGSAWTSRNAAGARAMSTALVLDADGRRKDGKWSYGSVAVTQRSESGTLSAQWKQRLAEAGIVLDHAPDLTEQVVNGDLALDAAHRPAHRAHQHAGAGQHSTPGQPTRATDSTAGTTHGQAASSTPIPQCTPTPLPPPHHRTPASRTPRRTPRSPQEAAHRWLPVRGQAMPRHTPSRTRPADLPQASPGQNARQTPRQSPRMAPITTGGPKRNISPQNAHRQLGCAFDRRFTDSARRCPFFTIHTTVRTRLSTFSLPETAPS